MTFETWLMFALTEAVICMIPGPAVLLVVSTAMTGGRATAIRAGLGVETSNALCFLLSAAGVGAVLVASHQAFVVIKWLGATYLFWLGAQMLLAGSPNRLNRGIETAGAAEGVRGERRRAFIRGFVTQAANPKALIFFVSLLPQFVDPSAPLLPQISILAITSMCIEIVIFNAYATVANRTTRMSRANRIGPVVERTGGALLICAAIGLASVSSRQP